MLPWAYAQGNVTHVMCLTLLQVQANMNLSGFWVKLHNALSKGRCPKTLSTLVSALMDRSNICRQRSGQLVILDGRVFTLEDFKVAPRNDKTSQFTYFLLADTSGEVTN